MLKFLWWLTKFGIVLFLIGMVIYAVGAVVELIAKYWVLILLAVILAVSAYYFAVDRSRKKSIPKPTLNLRALEQAEGTKVIATEKEMSEFMKSQVLVRSFVTKVVGVSYNNDDGSSRQEILSCCQRGEPVGFNWYLFNGKPACAIISDHGQIGHLKADLAADLDRNYGNDEYYVAGQICDITGGVDGLKYGCNIMLSIYGPAR